MSLFSSLARLRYTLPLIKEAIRYAKLGELHGFLGAGRYEYEKYYTMLKKREAKVRRKLEKLRLIRGIRRKARVEAGLPHVV
ncbi:MAG: GTPase HflX, partial [Desulfurococcaceae archaeon]